MDQPGEIPACTAKRRTVRWWATRVCLTGLIVGVVAYATLPVWLPTAWLSQWLEDRLSSGLSRPVQIGRVHVGWISGVVIEDLAIASEPGAPNEWLARVHQLRCGLTPLTTLFTGEVDQLTIERPELWLVFDEKGRLINLADLGHQPGRRLPTLRYSVRQAECHLQMPEATQTFRIDELECELQPETGLVRVVGRTVADRPVTPAGTPDRGSLSIEAQVTAPRLKHGDDDLELQGDVSIEWSSLALTDLPLPLAALSPIEQVDGTTTGRLVIDTHPDLGIDYDLFIVLNGVRILHQDFDRAAQVPDARLHCKGLWDPKVELLEMRELSCETPALQVKRLPAPDRDAILLDPKGDVPVGVYLTGRVKDWLALRREFPQADRFARAVGADFTGQADFSLTFERKYDKDHLLLGEDRLIVDVDGEQSRWVLAGKPADYLSADVGVPKNLHLETVRDRQSGELSQPVASLTVGDIAVRTSAAVILPESAPSPDRWEWCVGALPHLRCDIDVKVARIDEAAALMPILAAMTDVTAWRGPLELGLSVTPGGDCSRCMASIRMRPETSLVIDDGVFNKPAGRPLAITAGFAIGHQSNGRLDDFAFDVTHGAGRLNLDRDNARLDYRFTFGDDQATKAANEPDLVDRPIAVDATWNAPLTVTHIEDLLSLFPRWQRAAGREPVCELSGSCRLDFGGSVSAGSEAMLLQTELALDAKEMAIRWHGNIDKPSGHPLAIALSHWSNLAEGQREHSLTATVRQPAGELTGSIAFAPARSDDLADDFECLTMRAEIADLDEFLSISPALRERTVAFQPAGKLTLDVNSLLLDRRRSFALAVDATGADFIIPHATDPIRKKAGIAGRLELKGRADLSGPESNEQQWELSEGYVQLAGLQTTELTGTAVMRRQRHGPTAVSGLGVGPPILKSAFVQGRGILVVDEPSMEIHPKLAAWAERLGLSGSVRWDMGAHVENGALGLAGSINADDTNISIELENKVVSAIDKTPDTPLSVSFDLTSEKTDDGEGYDIDCRHVSVDLAGNGVTASGTCRLVCPSGKQPHVEDLTMETAINLSHTEGVMDMLTDSQIDHLTGSAAASARFSRAGDRFTIDATAMAFDNLAVGVGNAPLVLAGEIRFDGRLAQTDALSLAWANSSGTISGEIQVNDDHRPTGGLVGLAGRELDLDDLARQIKSTPWYPAPGASQEKTCESEAFATVIKRLGDLELDLYVNIDRLTTTLPPDVVVIGEAAVKRSQIHDGRLETEFSAAVDGGLVTGTLISDLTASDPEYLLTYRAERIRPGPVVDNYLAQTFPGMTASGPLTIIDQSEQQWLCEPGKADFEVGEGQLIIEGGTIEGRAAPLWMTRIFPGLNLASFEFSYMHSWFSKTADGRISHQMIYQGDFYNIYMDGYTDASSRMDYEIGIDFLADFDSRYWAESRQGRIPLFNKTGIVCEDGTLADERVEYVPRRFVTGLLVGNNPVVTAYHVVRKRVLGHD